VSRRGRPPAPLDPSASAAARLGADLRVLRAAHGLTLAGLSVRVGYSGQYISQVEHGRTTPSEAFVRACDVELGADGALVRLLPAVILEQAQNRSARSAARRGTDINSSDPEDDVQPITRRGLAAAGAARAAATLSLGATAAPTSARDVDPALPGHWERLLAIVGTYDAAHGPQDVLGATAASCVSSAPTARSQLETCAPSSCRWKRAGHCTPPGYAKTPATRAGAPRCWSMR
jgi:transcriptional regulator with XRE-family HTH domain